MRIFNKEKTQELYNVDLANGKLVADKLFIAHHDYIPPLFHSEKYINEEGFLDARVVIDRKSQNAYDKYEDIQVYIPYTAQEKQRLYKERIVAKIRRKYDINDEIALTNDKDTKPQEYAEYQAYRQMCKVEARAELNL